MLLINDLARHTAALRPELDAAISRVLDRGWFVHGPELTAFEQQFAAFTSSSFCAGVANGTDALEIALRATGVGPGRKVATVANAGMYSTAAILACGALPVYIDLEPGSVRINLQQLADAAPGVDAIVATHLYGRMLPIADVLTAAHVKPVIEDCAQAHGASLDGKPAGSWGALGCFSFYPTKNLGALGDGGAIVTSDPELDARVRALRQYGWKSAKYHAIEPHGRNSRLDELQAAILAVKLPHLPAWNQRRRDIATAFDGAPRGPEDVVHLYVSRLPDRDRILQHLRAHGIGAEIHYPIPDYRQPAVRALIGDRDPLPETERASAEVLTLPCFPEMTVQEVDETRRLLAESL